MYLYFCKEKPGNYKHVSLSSAVGKLWKGILRDNICVIRKTELIRDISVAFLCGKWSLTNLITFSEEVTKQVVEGRGVNVVHTYISKAFDMFHMVGYSRRLDCMMSRES